MRAFLTYALLGWGGVFVSGPQWFSYRMLALSLASLLAVVAISLARRQGKGSYAALALPLFALLADMHLAPYQVTLNPVLAKGLSRTIEGRICTPVQQDEARQTFTFCSREPTPITRKGHPLYLPDRLKLRCYRCDTPLQIGQAYRLRVKLYPRRPLQNPGDWFAWQKQWRYEPWRGVVTRIMPDHPGRRVAWQMEFTEWPYAVRHWVESRFGCLDHEATVNAMLVGDASGLSDAQWLQLRHSGLMHLVVVSGLHVSLMAALGVGLLQVVCRLIGFSQVRRIALVGGMLMVLGYLALVGFAVPVFRASLMSLTGMAFLIFRQRLSWFDGYLGAVLGTLLVDPFAFVSTGFWLSFGAVLILLASRSNSRDETGNLSRIVSLVVLQGRLFIGLLPVLAFAYSQVSLSGLLLNLVAVPLVTLVVMPVSLLYLSASALGGVIPSILIDLLAARLDDLLALFWWLASWGERVPLLNLQAFDRVTLLALMGINGFALCVPHPLIRVWLLVGTTFLSVGGEGGSLLTGREPHFNLTVLDVGQGLALVVRQGTSTLVYDTGPGSPGGWDAGHEVVVPFLLRTGVARLDTLVVSHGDNDHAGGTQSIRRAFPVDHTLLGEPGRLPDLPGEGCHAGQRFALGEAQVYVLWPPEPVGRRFQRNNRSCVLRIAFEGRSVLLTGDLEVRAQRRLVEMYGDSLRADVLLLPHHGAKSSFYPNLISAVQPAQVLVSSGFRNPFGHPHPEVIQWLARRDIPVANTMILGAVRVSWSRESPLELSGSGVAVD